MWRFLKHFSFHIIFLLPPSLLSHLLSPSHASEHRLSFLPATILTLAAALSFEDREVLAYLIHCSSAATPPTLTSFSGNTQGNTTRIPIVKIGTDGDHSPMFSCSCFRCYTSYWVRWDNRQLIHEIIDEFEEWLAQSKKGGKKEKRNKKGRCDKLSSELNRSELMSYGSNESGESQSMEESSTSGSGGDGGGGEGGGEKDSDEEKGSVRKFMNFIGEKIWGAWGQ